MVPIPRTVFVTAADFCAASDGAWDVLLSTSYVSTFPCYIHITNHIILSLGAVLPLQVTSLTEDGIPEVGPGNAHHGWEAEYPCHR
jgi:hypothetical protein